MTTQPGNEPTWYHRTVDAEPATFAGDTTDQTGGPDRRVKAIAAGFIVVILCAMGVSVAALAGEPPKSETAGAEAEADFDAAATGADEPSDEERTAGSGAGPNGQCTPPLARCGAMRRAVRDAGRDRGRLDMARPYAGGVTVPAAPPATTPHQPA